MTPLAWVLTVAAVIALLALDLRVSARRSGPIQFRQAAGWSLFYIAVAIGFGVVLAAVSGWELGTQYFAGYVVEKSLSIDNLFVFVIIISAFAVPAEHQSRALTIGIALALTLRVVFIALGAALLHAFSFTFVIFGLILLVTAGQLLRHRDEDPSVEDNPLVRHTKRRLPMTDGYGDGRVMTRVGGRRRATPMVLVLVAIATTDVLFALDSIPAVFGVTQHAYIVFCANAFALLGLRSLFFLVSGLLDRLIYLSIGLSVVLALIGVKLILHFAHQQVSAVPEISTGVSLGLIVLVLATTTLLSLIRSRNQSDRRAHSGSLRAHPPAPSAAATPRPVTATELRAAGRRAAAARDAQGRSSAGA